MFRSWSPCIPACTPCLKSHHAKNLGPSCLCWGEVAGSLLQPLNAAKWFLSTSIVYYVLVVPIFPGESLHFTTQEHWKLWMHIYTFQRNILLKDALCFLSGSAHLLLDTLDFHVWRRLSADCLCSSFFRFGDEISALQAEALNACLLQFCSQASLHVDLKSFRVCAHEEHKRFANQFCNLALGIANRHLYREVSTWLQLSHALGALRLDAFGSCKTIRPCGMREAP